MNKIVNIIRSRLAFVMLDAVVFVRLLPPLVYAHASEQKQNYSFAHFGVRRRS